MSIEKPNKLLAQWVSEELTIERAIGQMLQHVASLYRQLKAQQERDTALKQSQRDSDKNLAQLKVEVAQLKREVAYLQHNQTRILDLMGLPSSKPPAKRGRPPKG
ncbi:hypothetical protein QUF63_06190 [Anaerolineales bacterium HSG25]|nr:hypothetical protein [Anaerolineales bacterium HSG25]